MGAFLSILATISIITTSGLTLWSNNSIINTKINTSENETSAQSNDLNLYSLSNTNKNDLLKDFAHHFKVNNHTSYPTPLEMIASPKRDGVFILTADKSDFNVINHQKIISGDNHLALWFASPKLIPSTDDKSVAHITWSINTTPLWSGSNNIDQNETYELQDFKINAIPNSTNHYLMSFETKGSKAFTLNNLLGCELIYNSANKSWSSVNLTNNTSHSMTIKSMYGYFAGYEKDAGSSLPFIYSLSHYAMTNSGSQNKIFVNDGNNIVPITNNLQLDGYTYTIDGDISKDDFGYSQLNYNNNFGLGNFKNSKTIYTNDPSDPNKKQIDVFTLRLIHDDFLQVDVAYLVDIRIKTNLATKSTSVKVNDIFNSNRHYPYPFYSSAHPLQFRVIGNNLNDAYIIVDSAFSFDPGVQPFISAYVINNLASNGDTKLIRLHSDSGVEEVIDSSVPFVFDKNYNSNAFLATDLLETYKYNRYGLYRVFNDGTITQLDWNVIDYTPYLHHIVQLDSATQINLNNNDATKKQSLLTYNILYDYINPYNSLLSTPKTTLYFKKINELSGLPSIKASQGNKVRIGNSSQKISGFNDITNEQMGNLKLNSFNVYLGDKNQNSRDVVTSNFIFYGLDLDATLTPEGNILPRIDYFTDTMLIRDLLMQKWGICIFYNANSLSDVEQSNSFNNLWTWSQTQSNMSDFTKVIQTELANQTYSNPMFSIPDRQNNIHGFINYFEISSMIDPLTTSTSLKQLFDHKLITINLLPDSDAYWKNAFYDYMTQSSSQIKSNALFKTWKTYKQIIPDSGFSNLEAQFKSVKFNISVMWNKDITAIPKFEVKNSQTDKPGILYYYLASWMNVIHERNVISDVLDTLQSQKSHGFKFSDYLTDKMSFVKQAFANWTDISNLDINYASKSASGSVIEIKLKSLDYNTMQVLTNTKISDSSNLKSYYLSEFQNWAFKKHRQNLILEIILPIVAVILITVLGTYLFIRFKKKSVLKVKNKQYPKINKR